MLWHNIKKPEFNLFNLTALLILHIILWMILINMLQFVCSKKQIASRQLNSFNSLHETLLQFVSIWKDTLLWQPNKRCRWPEGKRWWQGRRGWTWCSRLPWKTPKKNIKFMKKSKTHCLIIRSRIHTHLLPSFSNAIAMRSLDLRNISIITMTASVTESKITAK